MGDRTYAFDAALMLSDNAAPYAASGYSQVAGADARLDLGGNQATNPKQQARIDAVVVVDITAITTGGTNKYNLAVLGSNDPNFGAGNVEMLGELSLGDGASRDGLNMLTSPIGRYEILFAAEQANQKYEYLKLRNTISGGPISYSAYVAVLPEP